MNRQRGSLQRARGFFLILVSMASAPLASSQMARSGGQQATPQNNPVDSLQTELHSLTDVQRQEGIDNKEFADYKRFYEEKGEPAKKVELGKTFLQKYPKSKLVELVDAGLVNAYIEQQNWPDVYSTAESALALKPDDVDILTTVGWVIPRVYQPDQPDSDVLLTKAETYEKHALDVLKTMPKPSGLKDAQFAKVKEQKTFQAHSALGLVYFRRSDYENSAKELQQAVENNTQADPADLYVLGIDLQNLKRPTEAVAVFAQCAAIPGSLQDRCKESADAAKKSGGQ